MARKLTLRCQHCGDKFTWRGEEWPDECPLCHSYVGLEGKPEVAAPHIALRGAKAADGIYRAMENGAEHRANVASEQFGIPKSDLAAMKITNMRDDNKPGEPSVKVDPSPVTAAMAANPHAYGFGGGMGADVGAIKSMVQNQPFAGSGLGAQSMIRDFHAKSGNAVFDFPKPDANPRQRG